MLDRWLEAARSFLGRFGATLVRLINDTTRDAIREIVAEGVAEGLSAREIAAEIREAWPEVARVRAERIARTETLSAMSYGQIAAAEAAEERGVELRKVWVSTPDARTRPSHRAAGGQERRLKEAFLVGGHPAMQPQDPNLPAAERVQCRCTVRFEVVRRAAPFRSWRDERDARIRADYPALKAAHGHAEAKRLLAERETGATGSMLDVRQVERILYTKGRA